MPINQSQSHIFRVDLQFEKQTKNNFDKIIPDYSRFHEIWLLFLYWHLNFRIKCFEIYVLLKKNPENIIFPLFAMHILHKNLLCWKQNTCFENN